MMITLVDDDDDESPSIPDTNSREQNFNNDNSSSSTRRYPLRQRHAPARYNDYVLSSIRDVCSKEGE